MKVVDASDVDLLPYRLKGRIFRVDSGNDIGRVGYLRS